MRQVSRARARLVPPARRSPVPAVRFSTSAADRQAPLGGRPPGGGGLSGEGPPHAAALAMPPAAASSRGGSPSQPAGALHHLRGQAPAPGAFAEREMEQ